MKLEQTKRVTLCFQLVNDFNFEFFNFGVVEYYLNLEQ